MYLWIIKLEPIKDILLIILGWTMGLFSPLIIEKIKSKKEKSELLKGFATELTDIRLKFAVVAFQLGKKAGEFNKEFIN